MVPSAHGNFYVNQHSHVLLGSCVAYQKPKKGKGVFKDIWFGLIGSLGKQTYEYALILGFQTTNQLEEKKVKHQVINNFGDSIMNDVLNFISIFSFISFMKMFFIMGLSWIFEFMTHVFTISDSWSFLL